MKNAKKALSIVLALVLLLSTFAIAASALTAENAEYVNVKYSLEQTNTFVSGGTEIDVTGTAHDGKVYALTMSVKAQYGLSYLQLPYYYNMDKFGQITLYDSGEIYYAYDGYASDMGENAVYDVYKLGPAWSDAGQYKADGSAAGNALQTKCFGLANASVAGAYSVVTKIVDSTTIGYDLWCEGITGKDFTVGCGFFTINNLFTKSKAAHMNVVNGKVVTDYVDIITVYLYNHSGDPVGEEIGAYTDWEKDTVNNIQVVWDTTGTTAFIAGSNNFVGGWASFIENSVVTAPSPVYAKTTQIRFNGPVDGDYAPFDVRTRAAMTAEDFAAFCGSDAEAVNNIEEVGFVYAAQSVVADFDKATAEAVIAGGEATGYLKVPVEHIQKANGEYIWTCLITGPDYDDGVNALGYIKVGGKTYVFDGNVTSTSFSALYDAAADAGVIPTA